MPAEAPFLTARNPYALAEAIAGGPIDWSAIPEPRAVLEDLLRTPYEQLFDPKFDSPVYLGFELNRDGVMRQKPVKPIEADADAQPDDERFPALDPSEIRRLADLAPYVGDPIEEVPVRSIVPTRAGGYVIEVGEAPTKRRETLNPIYDERILGRLIDLIKLDGGWTPDGGSWSDTGQFFREAAEFFDPVQGNLADCWLIAAMSSVAWAMPYTFAQRSRATGTPNERFVNLLELVDPANSNTLKFEATDETLVWSGTTSPMYGHSSEAGEAWPAIVEKAYAMWRGNTTNDHPNLTVLNGGDPVHASAALTGRKPHYTGTASTSATDLLNLVKNNCVNYRTVNPMTAWTYGSGDASPDKVNYADATIVACHAYSVLGWARGSKLASHIDLDRFMVMPHAAGSTAVAAAAPSAAIATRPSALDFTFPLRLAQDYIVLRNPWGNTEATVGEMSGVIPLRDISFWRSIDLSAVDGVFAIEPATFKSYFEGIGVAL